MNIIFNGPPSSGKDEGCEFLSAIYGFKHLSFKSQLFKDTIEYFGVDEEWFMEGYNRLTKDSPEYELQGLSRRNALIYVSEDVKKPKYGLSYYGDKTVEKLNGIDSYCFSDGGFKDEVMPVINKLGTDNICIIQIFRDNCSYSNDSRDYLNGDLQEEFVLGGKKSFKNNVGKPVLPVRSYQIHNNGSVKDFHKTIRTIYRRELDVCKKSDIS